MDMNIIPFVGLKDIRLGTNLTEVRITLGSPSKTRHFEDPQMIKDWYRSEGIITEFNDLEVCESIEFYLHSSPLWDGHELMGLHRGKIKQLMSKYGEAKYLPNNKTGLFYPNLGVGFYILENVVKSVILYPQGYYEELLQYYI